MGPPSPPTPQKAPPEIAWREVVLSDLEDPTDASRARVDKAAAALVHHLSRDFAAERAFVESLSAEKSLAVKREGIVILGKASTGGSLPFLVEALAADPTARVAIDALGRLTGEDFRVDRGAFTSDPESARRWLATHPNFVRTCEGIWTGRRWAHCVPLPGSLAYPAIACDGKAAPPTFDAEDVDAKAFRTAKCGSSPEERADAIRVVARECFRPGVRAWLRAALDADTNPLVGRQVIDLITRSTCPLASAAEAKDLYGRCRDPGQRAMLLEHMWNEDPATAAPLVREAVASPAGPLRRHAIGLCLSKAGLQHLPGLGLSLVRTPPRDEEYRIALAQAIGEERFHPGLSFLYRLLERGSPRAQVFAIGALRAFADRADEILPRLARLARSQATTEAQESFLGRLSKTTRVVGIEAETAMDELRQAARENQSRGETETARCTGCKCLSGTWPGVEKAGTGVLLARMEECPHYFHGDCRPGRLTPLPDDGALAMHLEKGKWYVQACAIGLLAAKDDYHARATIRRHYSGLSPEARRGALRALETDESAAAGRLMREAVASDDPALHAAAVVGLMRRGVPGSADQLAKRIAGTTSAVDRATLAEAFESCTDEACLALGKKLLVAEHDWFVRQTMNVTIRRAARRLKSSVAIQDEADEAIPDAFVFNRWFREHARDWTANRDLFLGLVAVILSDQDDLAVRDASVRLCAVSPEDRDLFAKRLELPAAAERETMEGLRRACAAK